MATYSSNTTIKIGSSITRYSSGFASFTFIIPENSYVLLTSVFLSAPIGRARIEIFIENDFTLYVNELSQPVPFLDDFSSTPKYLPSGTKIVGTTVFEGFAQINGIIFQNTP